MLPARRFNGQYGLTDFFNDFFENKSLERIGMNVPAINVKENDKEYKIEVAAPGMCKDDFKIHINRDGNLVIEMEKTDCGCKCKEKEPDSEKKECRYLRKEFSYSKFNQTLLLPDNADKEMIDAHVNNGILYIRIPKTTKEKVEDEKRMIEVKSGKSIGKKAYRPFFALFLKKSQKKFAGFKKMPTFASAFEKNA